MNHKATTTSVVSSYLLGELTSICSLPSLTIPGKRPPPPGFVIAFYGPQDTLAGLSDARQAARRDGVNFHRVDIRIEIGTPLKGTPACKHLEDPNIQLINLSRARKELWAWVDGIIRRPRDRGEVREILGRHPDRLTELFEHWPHLNAIAWPAPIPNTPNHRTLIAVRPSAIRGTEVVGRPDVRLRIVNDA